MYFKPNIVIKKNAIPIMYLDTNIMIELSKHEDGQCTNCYAQQVEQLFDLLRSLTASGKIICALGNQMEEMGRTPGRDKARDFLYNFTNAVLLEPYLIQETQFDAGYSAYVNKEKELIFNADDIFSEVCSLCNSSIEIHVTGICKPEKAQGLRKEKEALALKLNAMKESVCVAKSFKDQLTNELNGDYQAFQSIIEKMCQSYACYIENFAYLERIYRRMGVHPINAPQEIRKNAIENYRFFLTSDYHHMLPYVRIQSVLFAHLMQRSKKVIPSDTLDIIWGSAYLPFADYAVTDNSFCNLINEAGLSKEYKVKVFNMKSLGSLLKELSEL